MANPRDWIFCHFISHENGQNIVSRWVQNKQYKLYDTTGNFFNIQNDVMEETPLPENSLTQQQLIYKDQFQNILDSLK